MPSPGEVVPAAGRGSGFIVLPCCSGVYPCGPRVRASYCGAREGDAPALFFGMCVVRARRVGEDVGGCMVVSLVLVFCLARWVCWGSLGFSLLCAPRRSFVAPSVALALGCLVLALGGGALAVLWRDPVGAGARSCAGWGAGALVVRSSLCAAILAVVQMDKR